MKKLTTILSLLVFASLVLAACAAPAPEAPAPEPAVEEPAAEEPAAEEPAEALRVAVVMPSAINDLAFSQSMYDALVRMQEERGADNFEIAYSEGMFKVDEAAAALRDYAAEGYDLVIAHGSQYGSPLQEIAPDFPDTSFAWGTTNETFGIPNIFSYDARAEQGGYVNGVLAASLSESGIIGVVGPIQVGDARLYVNGFIAGAKATNPDVQVNENWIGSFSDVALASEAAQTHINAGADVLTGTAQMVVGAIGVAETNGVTWLGTQSDQSSLAPSIVAASQIYDWKVALDEIVALIGKGTLGGEILTITMANSGLRVDHNPDFAIPDGAKAAADEALAAITGGGIDALASAGDVAAAKAAFKAAFVYVAPIGDLGWTWAHDQARQQLEADLGIETAYIELVPEGPEGERVIRDFAMKGYDLIFTTSFGYMDPTITVAEEFPDTQFVHISGYKQAPNSSSVFGRMYQPRYLSGLVAGAATESNIIGYVAAFPIPEVIRGINAFTLGVREVNPAAEVRVVWTNTWFGPPEEKEAADALLAAGADIIAQHQDTTEPQKAAADAGALSIGYDSDMAQFVGDTVLTSPIWNWGVKYVEIAEQVMAGTYDGSESYWGGMPEGVVALAPLSDRVSADTAALVEEKSAAIVSGDWDVFCGPVIGANGNLVVAEGDCLDDGSMLGMDYWVKGVSGEVPGEAPGEPAADITENIGTMTLIMDVPQLDPHKMLSIDTIVGFNAYEWLVYSDPTEGLVPMLATSWESNATGDEWTFHLREGVTFHDGTPFTAEAVKFSYQRTIDLGMVSYQIDAIDEMEVIDDHTIRFGLSEPRNLPTIVSSFYGLYVANPNLADKPEGWYEEGNDSGTGPYYVESYDPQRVVLSQYKDYWGGWEEGQFTTVVFESVADAAVREQMIRSGEADVIAKLPFENHAALDATDDIKVVTSDASVGGFNLFNLFQLDLPPMDDIQVRQAISYAFPFGDVQEFSFSGLSKIAESMVPSSFLPPGELSTYSYDLEKAQSLLEAAGVEEGTEIKLALRAGDEEVKKISLLWQAELAKIGINMTVTEVASEWGVMFNTDSEYHVLAKTWSPGYPSPYEWLIFYDSRNTFAPYTGFVRPEVDAQLDQALSAEAVDKVGSDEIYLQVAQLLHDEAIMLPVMDFPFDYAIRSDISGFRGHPFTWTGRWYEYSRE